MFLKTETKDHNGCFLLVHRFTLSKFYLKATFSTVMPRWQDSLYREADVREILRVPINLKIQQGVMYNLKLSFMPASYFFMDASKVSRILCKPYKPILMTGVKPFLSLAGTEGQWSGVFRNGIYRVHESKVCSFCEAKDDRPCNCLLKTALIQYRTGQS